MQAVYKVTITPEEYLELEREAEEKSEYYRGQIFAMAGASEKHNRITVNTVISLGVQIKGRSCSLYSNDLRVKVSQTGLYSESPNPRCVHRRCHWWSPLAGQMAIRQSNRPHLPAPAKTRPIAD